MSIEKAHLQIQAASDQSRFYALCDAVVELSKLIEGTNPEAREKCAKIIGQADTLADIHKVRSLDYFDLVDKIDTARNEYRTLHLKAKGYQERAEVLKETLDNVLNSKI